MEMVSWAFPTAYANKAMRAILARGVPLLSMSKYLVSLAIYAVIAFVVGVLFFQKENHVKTTLLTFSKPKPSKLQSCSQNFLGAKQSSRDVEHCNGKDCHVNNAYDSG